MITSIGKFLRKIRIDRGEVLRDMANHLGVSSSFLSAVENGKKKFPEAWKDKLTELYNLSSQQVSEMEEAILDSSKAIEINMENASLSNRLLAISFARKFEELDEETSQKIINLLNNEEGE